MTEIGQNILFLHLALFSPTSIAALPILIAIIFILVFREDFYEYGIRTSLWFVLVIIIESWIWNWFVTGFNFALISTFFTQIEGYITILSLLGIVMSTAFAAAYLKEKHKQSRKKIYSTNNHLQTKLNGE